MGYDLLFQQAVRLHENGQLDEAEQIYRRILETAPDNADLLNLLGMVAQGKGLHSEAVSFFYKAVSHAPRHAPSFFNLGLSLQALEKPFEAAEAYNRALELDKNIKEAYLELGNIYRRLEQFQIAADYYRKALSLAPDYVEAQAYLADMENNVAALYKLTEAYSEHPLAFYLLGMRHFREKDWNKALAYFNSAEHLTPDDPDILFHTGMSMHQTGRLDEAEEYFRRVLQINPDAVPALVNIANYETNHSNFTEAETLYKRALELAPHDLNAHLNYAGMLYRNKRLSEALEEYRQAVIINPEMHEISNNLGIILKDLGEYEEALGLIFNAFLKSPGTEEYSVNIAETLTLFYRNQPEEALKIAENWIKQSPDNIFARHTLASFKGERIADTEIYSEKLFDHFADNYELVLQNISYNVVRELRNLTGDVKGTIVDLGCGSGLVGEAYKTVFNRIIGVDISEKMLVKAREKGCYEELIKSDILTYLQTKPQADFYIAADVFCYLGNLETVIKAASPVKLAFSVELNEANGKDYELAPSGRFRHNPQYVENLLRQSEYTDVQMTPAVLRQENGKDVHGMIFIAERSKNG